MKQIDKTALFRLSVIGQLVSREQLQRGELQQIIRELAQRSYAIPGSRRTQLGEKTIQAWYYNWLKGGIEALVPQIRTDRGLSKLTPEVQESILNSKRENLCPPGYPSDLLPPLRFAKSTASSPLCAFEKTGVVTTKCVGKVSVVN